MCALFGRASLNICGTLTYETLSSDYWDHQQRSKNITLVGRARHKICKISIYENLFGWQKETLWKSKYYFEVNICNSKGDFKKKNPKRIIQQRKTAGMSYIWFWVQWLVEHAPKSVQYKFTKLGRLTATHPKEGAKIILKLLFLTRRPVFRKKQRALWIEKKSENVLYFILSVLASRARPKICYTLTNWLVWR